MNNTTVGQRFTQLILHLGISKNAFAASLDKTATVIQHLVDERNKPGFDLMCKVFEVYPNVSKDWLLQGVGPMLTDLPVSQPPATVAAKADKEAALVNAAPTLELPTTPAAEASAADPATPPFSISTEAARYSSTVSAASAAAASPAAVPPATTAAPEPAPVAPASSDTSWQTALYTQQMAHQLALAELRNQHLQEQQRLMQQMMDLMQRQLTR